MPDRPMPVDGPHRIYTTPIPGGAALDITAFLESFVLALIRGHEDDLAELVELDTSAQTQLSHGNDDSTAGHARDLLVQQLVEQVGGEIRVSGRQALALADALSAIVRPKAVPGQRGAA